MKMEPTKKGQCYLLDHQTSDTRRPTESTYLTSKEKPSILIPPSEYEPSLSVVYALQYVNKMLLRSHIFYDKNDDSQRKFSHFANQNDFRNIRFRCTIFIIDKGRSR